MCNCWKLIAQVQLNAFYLKIHFSGKMHKIHEIEIKFNMYFDLNIISEFGNLNVLLLRTTDVVDDRKTIESM